MASGLPRSGDGHGSVTSMYGLGDGPVCAKGPLQGSYCVLYLSRQDSTGKFKVVQSTRWQELTQDIEAVASLSHLIGARTEFYPLNPVGAKPMIVTGKKGELEVLKAGLGQPRDRTPLAETTERIVDKVMDLAPSLLACGEKACVVIATDGKPTDGEDAFKRAVERLLKLPVFLVFRLCTNDEEVIDYYNELDAQRALHRVEPV